MADTRRWHFHRRIGRLQVRACLMRHRYAGLSPDRWVLQPSLVYDRKGDTDATE